MQPRGTLFIVLSTLFLLFILSLVFPSNGIKVTKGITLNFVNWRELFVDNKPVYKDISSIIQNSTALGDSLALDDDSVKTDTLQNNTILIDASSLKKNYRALEFPDNNHTLLYPMFRDMHLLKTKKELIRILHYGDSQIEGDRVTSFIRDKLQKSFGGKGVGLFPAVVINNISPTFNHTISQNWKRYALNDTRDTTVNHRRAGVLASFSRLLPVQSEDDKERLVYEGWIKLSRLNLSNKSTCEFSRCRLFYGHSTKPLTVELYENDKIAGSNILRPGKGLNEISWSFGQTPSEITLKFKGDDSPDFYALSFEDSTGIAVDNIPLRGSAGLEFAKLDPALLHDMFKKLNVKMVILEFGVNVVPNVISDYGYYERLFYSQLEALRRIEPELNIIVMGVSDMSMKGNNGYESYPNIPKIRDAQKRAAFRANCAFWDTFEAMGGTNSMPSWVFANPPLAQKDFTHFSPGGARIIGEMFYNSFITEYNEYVKQLSMNKEQ
jgi:hypothetical protein